MSGASGGPDDGSTGFALNGAVAAGSGAGREFRGCAGVGNHREYITWITIILVVAL